MHEGDIHVFIPQRYSVMEYYLQLCVFNRLLRTYLCISTTNKTYQRASVTGVKLCVCMACVILPRFEYNYIMKRPCCVWICSIWQVQVNFDKAQFTIAIMRSVYNNCCNKMASDVLSIETGVKWYTAHHVHVTILYDKRRSGQLIDKPYNVTQLKCESVCKQTPDQTYKREVWLIKAWLSRMALWRWSISTWQYWFYEWSDLEYRQCRRYQVRLHRNRSENIIGVVTTIYFVYVLRNM